VPVKIIAELNPLSRERIKLTAEAKTIAEIVTQLDSGFPLSQARVCRNGEIVKDFSLKARNGDTLAIKFVPYGDNPQGTGSAMKIGGWGLIALGAFIGFTFGWTGVGAGIGAALVGTGVSMAFGGTVLMNINIPTVKDREKPENDPSIRGGKNQARPHGRIPVLFGRHRLYPDLAANPHTSIIGNQQFFTQLFCGGYKDCVIDLESIRLGETSIVDLSQTKSIAQILAGADPAVRLEILQNGEASSLYPYCVHEDMINAPLQNRIDGADGGKISGEIVRTTPDNTDTINVDIFFHSGIGKYSDDGGLGIAEVEVRVYYKKAEGDFPYELLGSFDAPSFSFFSNTFVGGNVIVGAELKTKRFQITRSGLAPGKYTVKVVRLTADSTDGKVIDQVHVGSIRSIKSTYADSFGVIKPARPIRPERQKDLTIIALRVMATAKVNGVVDSFNYIATSKLPVFSDNGSGALYWLAAAETRNPAAMLLHALRGNPAQQRVDPGDIDWVSVENFYRWCEEHEYYCDAYLSESVTIAELLRMIGGTARADILRIDSKISVVQDIERPSHVQLFTPKNTKGYSVVMFSADIPDAVALRFVDKDAGYAQSELEIFNTPDGNKLSEPDTVQKTDLWGITDSAQARRIGMYSYACLKNRPFVHTIEVDIEYLLCNKGDRIQYAGDLALTGSVQGRIAEMLWSESLGKYTGMRLDEPVETEPGNRYAIRVRLSDGTVLLKDIATVKEPDEIYFTEPIEESNAPCRGDIYAFGIRGQEIIDLIITDIQPQADLSAVLTCVEYSPAIFDVDNPDFVLPEFENKITPVSGAVESGVAGPARWRHFFTYHDSEEEQPRPTGDGQNGGWHYAHTSNSLWQSSKTAESVDSGEWGQPVRIKGERGNTDTVPVYLTLSPQTKIFECDTDGNILAGLLPFTSQAALFKWNFRIPVIGGVERFPGTDGDLFDPMLGDFVPTSLGIFYSLVDSPEGVSIDQNGKITVAADAALEDEHGITVRAEFEGTVYSTLLFLQIKKRAGEARYLGTAETIPENNSEVFIIKGTVQGRVRAVQSNYVLAVADGTVGAHVWRMGYVYQWTGVAWEERGPESHSELYIRCFKDGLDIPELTQVMGWFGNLFAARFFALRAFIEALEAQVITILRGGVIESEGFEGVDGAVPGFRLSASDGSLEAIEAVFKNISILGRSDFRGDIVSGQLISSNDLTGTDTPPVVFSTDHTAKDVYDHYGAVSIPVSGSFRERPIWRLRCRTYDAGIGNGVFTQYIVEMDMGDDGSTIARQWTDYSGYRDTLGSALTIDGGSRRKIFRLLDLPPGAAGLSTGDVYSDSAGFLRIKH